MSQCVNVMLIDVDVCVDTTTVVCLHCWPVLKYAFFVCDILFTLCNMSYCSITACLGLVVTGECNKVTKLLLLSENSIMCVMPEL